MYMYMYIVRERVLIQGIGSSGYGGWEIQHKEG